jgi:CRISPR/Cas system-associated endonuclease/helicase Cas3
LDIDADKLYTRLCPIDAFGQRCGRVGRFGRKENKFDVIVLSEHSCKDYQLDNKLHWFFNKQFYEYSEFIYPKVILYKTLEYLENHKVINYPDDYRSQLNYVYDNLCETNGFHKFNEALQEYYNQIQNDLNQANNLIIKHGKTEDTKDVKTRNITNKDLSVLLYKSKHGDVINLYSGYNIDLSKKSFSMDDKINIEKNTVNIPIKNNFKNFGKLDEFKEFDDINLTAEVINNQIIINNNFDSKFSDYYYNSKEGAIKLI